MVSPPERTREYRNHHLDSTRWDSYHVRDGDTLWGIARQHNTTVARLRAANNLGSRHAIRPGQLLKLR